METYSKLKISVCALLLIGAVFSIRFQLLVGIVVSLSILLILTLWSQSLAAIVSLTTALLFLYPGPQIGWLYGRDSHSAALIARLIRESGWPIDDNIVLSWGTPDTPLMHTQAAMISYVTGLPLFPKVAGTPLVTALLPLIYVSVTLSIIFITARRFIEPSQDLLLLCILYVILWIPLYEEKIAFRRQSISILFFALIVYSIFVVMQSKTTSRPAVIIASIASLSLVLSHHFGSVIIAGVLLIVGITTAIYEWASGTSHKGKSFLTTTITLIILVLTWQVIFGHGAIAVLLAFAAQIAAPLVVTTADTGTDPKGLVDLVSVLAPWIYQSILAGGIIAGLLNDWLSNRRTNVLDWQILVGGGTIGLTALTSWVLGIVTPTRIMTYFVLLGGWIAPYGYYRLANEKITHPYRFVTATVLILAILSVIMLPPHIASNAPPRYQSGETDQRFNQEMYASAAFLDKYSNVSFAIGDGNTREIVAPSAQLPVKTGRKSIRTATVPQGAVVILAERNKYLYAGPVGGAWIQLHPEYLFYGYSAAENRIYTNGDVAIFANGS